MKQPSGEAQSRQGPRSQSKAPRRLLAVAALLGAIAFGGAVLASGQNWTAKPMKSLAVAQAVMATTPPNPAAPPSLKTVAVPYPQNLDLFVKSRPEAVALGKTLFWDVQVGSDGVTACATCHFNAGADNRAFNVVGPGEFRVNPDTFAPDPDWTFQAAGPNESVRLEHFPFTKFLDPNDRTSQMTRDWNDVLGSPGIRIATYEGLTPAGAEELGTSTPDPYYFVNGLNARHIEERNAPTVINAVFNFANLWDGRANNIFNGSSPWGDADPNAGVWWADADGVVRKHRVRIPYASLASQAVGPALNQFEMSFAGRTFADIGSKLLNPHIVPLGQQNVHPRDSVLARYARSTVDAQGRPVLAPGLNTTYEAMVQAAFHDQYWNSGQEITVGARQYSQMEANFSLFFGLAIALYESTLVSDDSPYDRFQAGDATAMSESAQEGLNMFLRANEPGAVGGSCVGCHSTATFSNASVMHIGSTNFGASIPEGVVERMITGNGGGAWYDSGYYNIGARPTDDDLGRGGKDPFGNPLSFIERTLLVANGQAGQLSYDPFATDPQGVMPLPCGPTDSFGRVCPADQRVATKGSFKTPTLRNVELTGPYMHNGGEATLMQVMDFYARGGNFFERDLANVDADIAPLFGLNPNPVLNPGGLTNAGSAEVAEANQRKLVDFLMALTDERVRWEQAPFDHPELLLPTAAEVRNGEMVDIMSRIPAVGNGGRSAEGLPPVGRFLGMDPYAGAPWFNFSVHLSVVGKK